MTELSDRLSQFLNDFIKFKYLRLVGLCLIGWISASFFWQLALLFNKPVENNEHIFFISPAYKENLLPDSTWNWTNYKDLYIQAPKSNNEAVIINLDITLLGIISSEPDGFAMLKIGKGKESVYRVGDILPGGYEISDIDINSITLVKGSARRVYSLTGQVSNIFLKNAPLTKKPSIISKTPVISKPEVYSLNNKDEQVFKEIEEKFIENPLAASNDVDIKEVKKNGSIFGYQIDYRINPELLRQLGLLPTDIIISINGIATPVIASNPKVIPDLMKENRFVIIYERKGVSQTLTVNR